MAPKPMVFICIGKILSWTFRIIMYIKLVGLFTETLVCVIVNYPLVLFITFLMYPVLPTHVFVDRFKMGIGKGGGYFVIPWASHTCRKSTTSI
jgi:hypothetical protein